MNVYFAGRQMGEFEQVGDRIRYISYRDKPEGAFRQGDTWVTVYAPGTSIEFIEGGALVYGSYSLEPTHYYIQQ